MSHTQHHRNLSKQEDNTTGFQVPYQEQESYDDDIYPCFTRLSLWSFIYDLLEEEKKTCVKWTDRENLEFKVEDTDGLANEWGNRKGRNSMTWPKFARAMRYYYGKNVLEKVEKKRFTYKFINSPKTKAVFNQKNRTKKCGTLEQSSTNTSSFSSPAPPSLASSSPLSLFPQQSIGLSTSTCPSYFSKYICSTSSMTTTTAPTMSLPSLNPIFNAKNKEDEEINKIKVKLELDLPIRTSDDSNGSTFSSMSSTFTVSDCHSPAQQYSMQNSTAYYYQQQQQQTQPTWFADEILRLQQQQQQQLQQRQQECLQLQPSPYSCYSQSPAQEVPNTSAYNPSSFNEYFSDDDFANMSYNSHAESLGAQFINTGSPNMIETTNTLSPCEAAILTSLSNNYENSVSESYPPPLTNMYEYPSNQSSPRSF